MIPNPTPKQKIQSDPEFIKSHRALLEIGQLELSLDRALLQMQRNLKDQMGPDEARAAHYMMSGAIEFLDVFKKLAEPPPQRKQITSNQLNEHA